MTHNPTWTLDHFFRYNSNSNGKTITVWVNGNQNTVSKKVFSNITTTFQLTHSAKVYKINKSNVETML